MTTVVEAAFISDLHLNQACPEITEKFEQFIDWALVHTRVVYILGDFFHVWAGDDLADDFSLKISLSLKKLKDSGISVFFMAGNRDFLIGKRFAKACGMQIIKDETAIHLSKDTILLAHGDAFCTKDRRHQWFRRLTRNRTFSFLFLSLPKWIRQYLVLSARKVSKARMKKYRDKETFDVISTTYLKKLQKKDIKILIHGHTHRPGLNEEVFLGDFYKRYVLSDWDSIPMVLCYNSSQGLYFDQNWWRESNACRD